MAAARLLRANAAALLLALLFVPALTQPARRLSPRPADQGSSFSRLGVLSNDRLPVASRDAAVLEAAAVVEFVPEADVTPVSTAPAGRVLLLDFGPPRPLRAPPALSIP